MVVEIITAAIITIVTLSIGKIFNILPKIAKTIKLQIQLCKKKHMMEKGTEFSGGLPIFKSPKGYLYTVSDDQKSLYCAGCYNQNSKLIRLEKKRRKVYVCPVCNAEYKT